MPTHHQNNAPATDAALMERIGEGDRIAFTMLVDRHLARAVHFTMRHVQDKAIAEDIVQEGFFKVWQHAHRWEPHAQFTTWFYKMLYHGSVDYWRKNRRPMENIDDMSESFADAAPIAEESLIEEQQRTLLNRALGHLPENQRTALLLFHQQELSQHEIAQIMDASVGAVESLLFRARQKLKTIMQRDAAQSATNLNTSSHATPKPLTRISPEPSPEPSKAENDTTPPHRRDAQ